MFCCSSTRSLAEVKSEKQRASTQEAEARHARVASVLSPPPRAYIANRPLSFTEDQEAPPPYCAAQSPPNPYASPRGMSYDQKDEKQGLTVVTQTETDTMTRSRRPSSTTTAEDGAGLLSPRDNNNNAFSDTSSVISTPSTQVTGLGSVYTGRFGRRGSDGQRSSDEFSTRPPTYYERSIGRRSSNASSTETATGPIIRHPVMGERWFEGLGEGQGEGRGFVYGE